MTAANASSVRIDPMLLIDRLSQRLVALLTARRFIVACIVRHCLLSSAITSYPVLCQSGAHRCPPHVGDRAVQTLRLLFTSCQYAWSVPSTHVESTHAPLIYVPPLLCDDCGWHVRHRAVHFIFERRPGHWSHGFRFFDSVRTLPAVDRFHRARVQQRREVNCPRQCLGTFCTQKSERHLRRLGCVVPPADVLSAGPTQRQPIVQDRIGRCARFAHPALTIAATR